MLRMHLILAVVALACLSTAVAADLLVTREGETIETRGPWKVKGRQVVFTNSQGVLSSLRLADIDIEASEEATKQASEPPPPEAEEPQKPKEAQRGEPRKAARSFTNANIRAAAPETDDGTTGGTAAGGVSTGGIAAGGIATKPPTSGAESIRVTLGSVSNGYSVTARVNGTSIPNFSGGSSQIVQLFHVNHPNRSRLTAQDAEFVNLFCLKEGANEIEIEYEPIEPASILSLRFYMNAPNYSSAIFEFEQEARKSGSLATTFEIYPKMPADHKTQVLN